MRLEKYMTCRMERHPQIDFLCKCITAEEFAKPTQEGRHSSLNDTVINLETNYSFTEAESGCPRLNVGEEVPKRTAQTHFEG